MIRNTISEEMDETSFDQDETPWEGQPPLSPAGGAESLFLAGLATSKISADALSTRLRQYTGSIEKRSVSAASIRSVLTDDFQSCVSQQQYSDDVDSFPITPIQSDDEHDDDTTFFSIFRTPSKKMSSSASTSSKKSKPVEPTPTKEAGMDVAENVYEKAKDIWA
jgi:hypothetical protein